MTKRKEPNCEAWCKLPLATGEESEEVMLFCWLSEGHEGDHECYGGDYDMDCYWDGKEHRQANFSVTLMRWRENV